jgi:hypothetical protein
MWKRGRQGEEARGEERLDNKLGKGKEKMKVKSEKIERGGSR